MTRVAATLTWSSENIGPVSAGMTSLVLEGSDWLYSAKPRESPMMVSEPRVPVPGLASGILVALVHVRPCTAWRQKSSVRQGRTPWHGVATTHIVGRGGHARKSPIWVIV